MYIQQNGNVGIGTTTPGSTLQVNGGAAIGYNSSTAAPANGLAVAGHVNLEGVTSTGATGTGNLVFSFSDILEHSKRNRSYDDWSGFSNFHYR